MIESIVRKFCRPHLRATSVSRSVFYRASSTLVSSVLASSILGVMAASCGGDDEETDSNAARSECEMATMNNPDAVCAPTGPDDGTGFLGGDDDGTGTTPGTSGDLDEDEACADSSTYVGQSLPSALQLVVDTSCSMAQGPGQGGGGQPDGDDDNFDCDDEEPPEPFNCGSNAGNGSKWQITRDALRDSLDLLGATTQVGLSFYPFPPNTPNNQIFAGAQCDCFPDVDFFIPENTVPLAALTDGQRGQIEDALGDAVVSGSTPTHAAYLQAVQYLQASSFEGNRYVVLLTDGDPTYGLTDSGSCTGNGRSQVNSENLIDDVADAFASGIGTFIIGSPGSQNARVDLSRMAEAGGTARAGCSSDDDSDLFCHLDMTTEEDFGEALTDALGEVVEQAEDPCVYNLPMPTNGQTIDRTKVNVSYTDASGESVEILRDPMADQCNSGWQYINNETAIQLCDDACNAVLSSGDADVDILVGCRDTTFGEPAR